MSVRLLKKQLTDHDARVPLVHGRRRPMTKERRQNIISSFARERRRAELLRREELMKSRARLARENRIELELAGTTRRALAATAPRAVAPPASTAALLADKAKTTKKGRDKEKRRRRFGDDEDSGQNDIDDEADIKAASRQLETDFVSAKSQTLPGDYDDDDEDAYDVGARHRGGGGGGRWRSQR
jgi:hypothetical protein